MVASYCEIRARVLALMLMLILILVVPAAMAEVTAAERATGYVAGGISPLGQKQRLPCALDESALAFPTIFVSAGRRGLEIELSPSDGKTELHLTHDGSGDSAPSVDAHDSCSRGWTASRSC